MEITRDNMENNSKQNNSLTILLSVLLLISCIIAGFFAYQTQNLTEEIKRIRSQTIPSPTIFSTAQPKADWKIDNNKFTSSSLGFEVTFPKSWKLDFSLADWGKDLYILTALNEVNHYSVLIFIAPKNGDTLPGPTGFGAGEWSENGSINILGQKLIKKALIYEDKTENIMYSSIDDRVIDFPNSNMLFNFIVQSNIDSNYNITSQFQKEVDQILSTFKFLDKESIPAISTTELQKGWYWGFEDQKKLNTPSDWVFFDAGRSSCWHKVGVNCI
jgi:hypothetical protein